MKNAKLKEQFTSLIALHFDRELWYSRPEAPYEEAIEGFVNDLIRVATYHKRGWKYHSYKYTESELFAPSILGEQIGEKIKEFRFRKGWTLNCLAKKAGVDAAYLQGIEHGEPILRLWAFESILDALKIRSSRVLPF